MNSLTNFKIDSESKEKEEERKENGKPSNGDSAATEALMEVDGNKQEKKIPVEEEAEVESEFERIKKNAKAVKESIDIEKKAKKSRPSKNLSKYLESKKDEPKPRSQDQEQTKDGSGSLDLHGESDHLQNGDSRKPKPNNGKHISVIPSQTKSIPTKPTPSKSVSTKPTPSKSMPAKPTHSKSILTKLTPSKPIPTKPTPGPKLDEEESITIGRLFKVNLVLSFINIKTHLNEVFSEVRILEQMMFLRSTNFAERNLQVFKGNPQFRNKQNCVACSAVARFQVYFYANINLSQKHHGLF